MPRLFVVVLLAVIWALPAQAQDAASTDPLTRKDIARWAMVMAPLSQWADANEAQLDGAFRAGLEGLTPNQMPSPDQIERMRAPFSYAAGQIEEKGLLAEPNAIVAAQGFDSLADWAALSDRIMRGYISHRLRERAPSSAEVRAQMAQIEASATLSDAQKQSAKERLERGLQIVSIMDDVPDADVVAIRQNLSIVANVFGG